MKLLMFCSLVLLVCEGLVSSSQSLEVGGMKEFGFGIQRMKFHDKLNQEQASSDRTFLHSYDLDAQNECINVSEHYFSGAVIDNFAPISQQLKWKGKGQRYWINDALWGGPGYPVFVYVGGEWEESCKTLTSQKHLFLYELAIEHKALLLDVEHRFYGDSFPLSDTSMASLQYLTALQGIADLARLLDHVINIWNATASKVVTVGGSYAGNLVAWFRLKYPHISYASIASSAPLIAKENFFEYMEVVKDAMVYFSGDECVMAFKNAADDIAALAMDGPGSEGYKQLDKLFNTCAPINNTKDLSILLSNLMGNIQVCNYFEKTFTLTLFCAMKGTVQYNLRRENRMNVTDMCSAMLNASSEAETDLDRFAELMAVYLNYYSRDCEDASWNSSIVFLSNTTNDPRNNHRPWVYQTCNEFGYFQTTDSSSQPFSSWTQLGMDFYKDICFEAYDGWDNSPQVNWINTLFGGTDIAATNIIFPAGSIDPWHVLGINDETDELWDKSLEPEYIIGTAHCHDLSGSWHTDPPALTSARESIAWAVSQWINTEHIVDENDSIDNSVPDIAVIMAIIVVVVFLVGMASFAYYQKYGPKGDNGDDNSSTHEEEMLSNPIRNL